MIDFLIHFFLSLSNRSDDWLQISISKMIAKCKFLRVRAMGIYTQVLNETCVETNTIKIIETLNERKSKWYDVCKIIYKHYSYFLTVSVDEFLWVTFGITIPWILLGSRPRVFWVIELWIWFFLIMFRLSFFSKVFVH